MYIYKQEEHRSFYFISFTDAFAAWFRVCHAFNCCYQLKLKLQHVSKMETSTSVVGTTGIPALEKGNVGQTSHGSDVGELLENSRGTNVDFCALRSYTSVSLSDFLCSNVESNNNSIQDGDQSPILCDIVSDSKRIPVEECDNIHPFGILWTYVADVNKGNLHETSSTKCVPKNVCSSTGIVRDEPLNLTTVEVKDVNKLPDVGTVSDMSTMTIEEQQKKLNESISAIAKSLGLEDFLPENFQVDTCKDVLSISVIDSSSSTAQDEVRDRYNSKATRGECSQKLINSVKPFVQNFVGGSQISAVPLVHVITSGKTDCPRSYMKSVANQKKLKDVYNSEDESIWFIERLLDNKLTEAPIKNGARGLSKEPDHKELAVENPNDSFPVIHLGSSSDSLQLQMVSLGSGSTTESSSIVKANQKRHFVLSTSGGQHIVEICDDNLNALSNSDVSPDKESSPVICSEVPLQATTEPEALEYNEEMFCDSTPLVHFVQKLTTSNRSQRKIFTCSEEGCGHVFSKECKLRAHMICHKGVRPYKCTFDGCDWAFSTPYRLRRHLDTHMGKKDYICDFEGCSRRFTTIYNLNTHKKRHKWPNSLVCPAEGCEMTFANRRKMELHLRVHEDIEAPYKCSVCGKKYYSANCIASHYRSHQYSEDDFKCPFPDCGKKYDKICRLRQHIRHHTGERPYTCPAEDCHWSFMSASKLTRHMRKHTGERKFTCSEPGCGKSFLRPEHLKGHVVIHSGTKPFQCPHEDCSARFTAKSSLYVHVKKHCGNQVKKVIYPCPVSQCGHTYSTRTPLEHHLKKLHPGVLPCMISPKSIESDSPYDFAQDVEYCTPESLSSIKTEEDIAVTSLVQNCGLSSVALAKSRGKSKKAPPKKLVNNVTKVDNASKSESAVSSLLSSPMKSFDLDVLNPLKSVDTSKLTFYSFDEGACSSSNVNEEIDSSSRLLHENSSGSARTDYCCNHILSMRAKKWRLLQNQTPQGLINSSEDSHHQDSNISFSSDGSQSGIDIRSPDVMLASSSFVYQDHTTENLVQTHFLPDVPSSNSIYQDDSILVNSSTFGSELAMPSSLLSDRSDSEGSEITRDSSADVFSTSAAVDEFSHSAMSLHDL